MFVLGGKLLRAVVETGPKFSWNREYCFWLYTKHNQQSTCAKMKRRKGSGGANASTQCCLQVPSFDLLLRAERANKACYLSMEASSMGDLAFLRESRQKMKRPCMPCFNKRATPAKCLLHAKHLIQTTCTRHALDRIRCSPNSSCPTNFTLNLPFK